MKTGKPLLPGCHSPSHPPYRLPGQFLLGAFIGSLAVGIVSIFGTTDDQLVVLGVIASSILGLQLSHLRYSRRRDLEIATLLREIAPPRALIANPLYLDQHRQMTAAIAVLAGSSQGTLRDLALANLTELNSQIFEMADGRLIYEQTETWRTVYEDLLRKPSINHYYSVAWFRGVNYWQDIPGQQSLSLNCQLAEERLQIHRTVIVTDDLWPGDSILPLSPVIEWIERQHVSGILVRLVRESQLAAETNLLTDFGLYGDEAVGFQIVDETGRTTRFELDFRDAERLIAQRRWERINLFATSYGDLLDQRQQQS